MSDLGKTLREAREAAGISLSGMSSRTGYSDGYLGNVETGVRRPTPKIIRAYERVLGDDLNRRTVLLGLASAVAAATTAPDIAVDVFRDITAERSRLLSTVQTSHATDKMIAYLVSKDLGSLGSISTWANRGNAVLRVNSLGIMAKIGTPALDNTVATSLRADSETRTLYLTAVAARVLQMPWDEAGNLVRADRPQLTTEHVGALSGEVQNLTDSGARWCSIILLGRARPDHGLEVDLALRQALKHEPATENLRNIGFVLAGIDPLTI